MNEQTNTADKNQASLKTKQKSRNYPRQTLQGCLKMVEEIKHKCGADNIHLDVLIGALGFSGNNGGFQKKFSAAKQFNLIKAKSERVSLTRFAKDIFFPISEESKKTAIIECFKYPPLYKELIEKFVGSVIPPSLPNILYKDFKISEAAKDDAAIIFIESGKFAGLINEENRLIDDSQVIGKNISLDIDEQVNEEEYAEISSNPKPAQSTKVKESFEAENGQHFKLKFSNGAYANIFIPDGFTQKDLDKLIYQINVLKFDLDE